MQSFKLFFSNLTAKGKKKAVLKVVHGRLDIITPFFDLQNDQNTKSYDLKIRFNDPYFGKNSMEILSSNNVGDNELTTPY